MEEGIGALAVPATATVDDLETWWAEAFEHARPTQLRASRFDRLVRGGQDAVQDAVVDAISQQKTDAAPRLRFCAGAPSSESDKGRDESTSRCAARRHGLR